jgi:hypothetical protein
MFRSLLIMMKQLSIKLMILTILVALTGLGFFILEETEINVSINGVVCNYSSTHVWLALSKGERTGAYSLAPDQCTDMFTQDVEAIWGKDCTADSCSYEAWKLGAGRFTVYNDATSPGGFALHVRGWGAGSRWHISEDWPKPDLSSIGYSLVK